MSASPRFLSPSEAAGRLGVSAKALRLYERRGLVEPGRSAAGWRVYGSDQMARLEQVVALRALGFSLAQVARALAGDDEGLEPALAEHQAALEGRLARLQGAIGRVRGLRDDLARGRSPTAGELVRLAAPDPGPGIAFELPWPWGGETFELGPVRKLTYIVGPLGSGKTRLARRLAETLPGAAFIELDRVAGGATARARLEADPELAARVERTLAWMIEDGATVSDALLVLLAEVEAAGTGALIVDLVEHGLDQPTQEALTAQLRRRGSGGRPLFLMTRSNAVLDLAAVGPDEAIILCPANHSPPTYVGPYPGAPGYEAVASCLASPEVRARTEGMVAWLPEAAGRVSR